MRPIAALSLSLALLFSQAGLALASTAENSTTGPGSSNTAVVEEGQNVSVTISHTASVSYNINLTLNTGNNTMSNNTTASSLESGSVEATVSLATDINQGGVCDGCLPAGGSGTHSASNSHTGPDSSNEARVEVKNNVEVDVTNKADVDYNLTLAANTGGNRCTDNTLVGDCRSGDIRVGIDLTTRIDQGVGGGRPEEEDGGNGGAIGDGKEEAIAGVTTPTLPGVGGALFAAGSSLLLVLLALFAAANGLYLLRRFSPLAFHYLSEGKVVQRIKH